MDPTAGILRASEQLYAAVGEPERWPGALEAIADVLRGDHAILMVREDGSANDPFVASARVEPSSLARFFSADGVRAMAPLFNMVPVGVATRTEFLSDADFARTEAYNELIRPMNGFYGIHLRQTGVVGIFLNVCRPLHSDNFDETNAIALERLAPHLEAALDLHRRLQSARHGHASLARLLDRLDSGVILVDGTARPKMLNERATRIVAEADGLTADAAGLAASTPAGTLQLREAIAAMSRDTAIGPQRLRLDRPSRRLPLLLTVFPIWRLDAAGPSAATARVAVFVAEPDAPLSIDRTIVAETFGLTRRESEIAVLLANGTSRDMIATQLALGRGTVREHLRHVFAKTGVRSQPALVALLRGFIDRLQ